MRTFMGTRSALALTLVCISLMWVCEGPAQAIDVKFCPGTSTCTQGTVGQGTAGNLPIPTGNTSDGVISIASSDGTPRVDVSDSGTAEWLKLLGTQITFLTDAPANNPYPIVITADTYDASPDLTAPCSTVNYRILAVNQSFMRGGVPLGDQVTARGFVNLNQIGTVPTGSDPYLLKIFYAGSGTTFFPAGSYNQECVSAGALETHNLKLQVSLVAKKGDVVKFVGTDGLVLKYIPNGGEGETLPTDCDGCPCPLCQDWTKRCIVVIIILIIVIGLIWWRPWVQKVRPM